MRRVVIQNQSGEEREPVKFREKFYDLNKSPIICPCPEAVEFDPNDYLKQEKLKVFHQNHHWKMIMI